MIVWRTAPYVGLITPLLDVADIVGPETCAQIDARFATVNVRLSLNDNESSVVAGVPIGCDAHFRRTFDALGQHAIAMLESCAREQRTWETPDDLRLCSGPRGGCRTGGVELWLATRLPWAMIDGKEASITEKCSLFSQALNGSCWWLYGRIGLRSTSW